MVKRENLSESKKKKIRARDEHQCVICGEDEKVLEVHHITPISKGGSHKRENLVTLCRPCHAEKHPRIAALIRSGTEKKERTAFEQYLEEVEKRFDEATVPITSPLDEVTNALEHMLGLG